MCKYFKKKTPLPRCGNGALASKIVKGLGAVKIEVVVHHVAVEHAVKGTLHLVLTFPRYAYRIGQQTVVFLALAKQVGNDRPTKQTVDFAVVDQQLPAFAAASVR